MIFKGKFLVLEGPDCCGKSTLLRNTFREVIDININAFICDRGMPSSIVYGLAKERPNLELDQLIHTFEKSLKSNKYIYFYLKTPLEVTLERLKNEGDDRHVDIEFHKNVWHSYNDFFMKYSSYANVIILEDYENYFGEIKSIVEDINSDASGLNVLSDFFIAQDSAVSQELTDYNLSWVFKNIDEIMEVRKGINHHVNSLPKKRRDEFIDIEKKEKYERNMIMGNLFFNAHIQMSKFKEDLDSRRFISHNDSCISFFQVLFRADKTIVSVKMRSANSRTNLLSDIRWLLKATHESVAFANSYNYSDNFIIKGRVLENPIEFNLEITSLHYE